MKKRTKTFIYKLLVAVNVLAVIPLVLTYFSPFISPADFWPLAFLGLVYPLLLGVQLVFLIFWLLTFRKAFFLPLIVIAAGWFQLENHLRLFPEKITPDLENSVKVMSFNARYFGRYYWDQPKNIEVRNDVFAMIDSLKPDVICFQEFYNDNSPYFSTVDSLSLRRRYPYYYTDFFIVTSGGHSFGMGTFSKFPIVNRIRHQFINSENNYALITDIRVQNDTFRIMNIHFESIRLTQADQRFIQDLTQRVDVGTELKRSSKLVYWKMKSAFIKRSEQIEEIVGLIFASPFPVIICTDLNDTPASFAYRQLDRKLYDAFLESGSGFGNTYTRFWPPFRIDYIFHSPAFESYDFRIIRGDYSDHYPIMTTLSYRKKHNN